LLPFELGSFMLDIICACKRLVHSNYEGCYLCETLFSGPWRGISIQPLLSLSYQLDQT
jgi:hypothetical protein